MNKKFTLLAAALMTVGTFTAASAASDVPSKEWTVGNYNIRRVVINTCLWMVTRLIR